MKIKATLKKLKRGDVVSIDWIDAGDLDDSPSSWFSKADAEKACKEIPVTDMLYKRYGHFTDEKRRGGISLFDKGTKSTECGRTWSKLGQEKK